ncbi:hypothetical protein EBZ80_26300 [bacterium]|nr:hypothetical protein [bacterium]
MANEFTLTARLAASKGGSTLPGTTYNVSPSMSGTYMGYTTQSIGTTEESLTLPPDVATAYKVLLVNNDATNYIEVGTVTTSYKFRIPPGEMLLIPYVVSSTTIYLKANTAACIVQAHFAEV